MSRHSVGSNGNCSTPAVARILFILTVSLFTSPRGLIKKNSELVEFQTLTQSVLYFSTHVSSFHSVLLIAAKRPL